MPENKRKQQSFEYGAIILLCSTILVKLIGGAFKIPLSNLIGDLGFGYFSSAYDLFNPIYSLAMAGLPIAVSRVVAEHMSQARYKDVRQSLKITRRIFWITGLVALIVMFLLIKPFVAATDKTGQTVYSIYAIAPTILFCCVMSAFRGYYEGLRNMYPTAISDIIEAMSKLVLGYLFAYIVMKVSGNVAYAAAGAILGVTVGAVLAAAFLELNYRIKGDGISPLELQNSPDPMKSREAAKALIVIAIPIALSSLANSIASLVDVSMVKWQLSNLMGDNADTIREMYKASISEYNTIYADDPLTNDALPTFLYGIRSKAFTIYNLIHALTTILGVSALPVLATSWTQKNMPLVKKNIESMLKFIALVAVPSGVGLIALGGPIMGLLYKTVASVEIGGSMLSIYGIAAVFAGVSVPMTNMLQAVGKQVASLRNVAIGALIKVVFNYIFVSIPQFNIKGAAMGTCICYVFIFIANTTTLVRATGIVPNFFNALGKPTISAIACGFAAYGVSLLGDTKIHTLVAIIAAVVTYFVALVILNTFEEDDVLSLPKGDKLAKLMIKLRIIRKNG